MEYIIYAPDVYICTSSFIYTSKFTSCTLCVLYAPFFVPYIKYILFATSTRYLIYARPVSYFHPSINTYTPGLLVPPSV